MDRGFKKLWVSVGGMWSFPKGFLSSVAIFDTVVSLDNEKARAIPLGPEKLIHSGDVHVEFVDAGFFHEGHAVLDDVGDFFGFLGVEFVISFDYSGLWAQL